VLPIADAIASNTMWEKEKWTQLEQHTEAAYYRLATAQDAGDESGWIWPPNTSCVSVVCTNNLQLYSGYARDYRVHYGNLHSESAREMILQAIDAGPVPFHIVKHSVERLPSIGELTQTVADPHGQRLYMHAGEMRWRWLDQWVGGLEKR
jgi:hypothetical protein